MKGSRKYFRKPDLLIIFLVIITSVMGFVFLYSTLSSDSVAATAEIRVNTRLYDVIDLTKVHEPYEITVEGKFPVTLEVSARGVRFIHSDCPDKLCIHQGLIESGRSAACLPAGVSVSVKGQDKASVDAVAG